MKTFIIFFWISFKLSTSFAQIRSSARDSSAIVHRASLIQLIATPEKYDGRIVQVVGFLNIEFEGDAIYLHQEDFNNYLATNGFRVNFSERIIKEKRLIDYSKKYVILEGMFKAYPEGSNSFFTGQINSVYRLDIWPIHK